MSYHLNNMWFIDLYITIYYIMPLCKNDPKRKYKGDEPSPKGWGGVHMVKKRVRCVRGWMEINSFIGK